MSALSVTNTDADTGAQQPPVVTVTNPAGEPLQSVGASGKIEMSGYEFDTVHYETAASTGGYEISIESSEAINYTVAATGTTADGGEIDDSYSAEIDAGERQSVQATLPENPGDTGSVGSNNSPPPSGPEQRVLQITGRSSTEELTQDDVSNIITLFNRNETVNSIIITQDDISNTITLFERN